MGEGINLSTGKVAPVGRRLIQKSHLCVIYVIAADTEGPSKVGITTDIMTRIRTLQTGCWLPLRAYDFRVALPKVMSGMNFNLQDYAAQGAQMAERDVHSVLVECGLRMVGEWFDVTPEEALAVIDKCATRGDYRSVSLEQVAGASTSEGLDPEVHKARNRLAGAMLQIRAMAADASGSGLDTQGLV
jgi:hypothetical protein